MVLETFRPLPVHRLGQVPPFVLGTAGVRGQSTPVIDLALLLGLSGGCPAKASPRWVVVKVEVDGEPIPEPGQPVVIMAPADEHLIVDGGRLRLWNGPPRHSCGPSVDVLFESIASSLGGSALACLLTGMGRDGALGLLAIRKAGGLTLAQDEGSSVVYGMPREPALLGAAERVLTLDAIAPALVQAVAVIAGGANR